MFCIHKSFKSELQFCILFLKGNWAYKTNLFICIKNLKPKNAILSKGIFLANCVNTANFLIIWCPYLSRVGESLSLCILKTTNFRLYVKQNVPTYGALSTKNFCSKSNTFWDISSQSFQIGSGTPCIMMSSDGSIPILSNMEQTLTLFFEHQTNWNMFINWWSNTWFLASKEWTSNIEPKSLH